MNVLLLVIGSVIIYGLFTILNPLAATLVMLIAGLCITRYPAEFYAARVIERSILRDMKEKQPEIEYIGEDE